MSIELKILIYILLSISIELCLVYFFLEIGLFFLSIFLFVIMIIGAQRIFILYDLLKENTYDKVIKGDSKINYIYEHNYSVHKISRKEYEKLGKITTEKELKRLFHTKEFKEMYKIKGKMKVNWVWQTNEKITKLLNVF